MTRRHHSLRALTVVFALALSMPGWPGARGGRVIGVAHAGAVPGRAVVLESGVERAAAAPYPDGSALLVRLARALQAALAHDHVAARPLRLHVTASALSFTQQQILDPSDAAAGDGIGSAVALSADGRTALAGAQGKTVGHNQTQGAVYVFVRSGNSWSQQQRLTAADGADGDSFGDAVALSADGRTALVGAKYKTVGNNQYQGAAYVFERSGNSWSQQQRLTAADGAELDYFGSAVALSADGRTALIGTQVQHIPGQGAAYVFVRSGSAWSSQQRLTAPGAPANNYDDRFGTSVALSADGHVALVGAAGTTVGGHQGQGVAYVFVRSGRAWSGQQRLTAAGGTAFGESLALSADGHVVLVGGNYNTTAGGNQTLGAAYVFGYSGNAWLLQRRLTVASTRYGPTSNFGASVALSADGHVALVGANYTTVWGNQDQGLAFVFRHSGSAWSLQQLLLGSDGAHGDEFGDPVALNADGRTALIGASAKSMATRSYAIISQQGVAYVFWS